jgi:hypothetical protein
MQAHDGLFPQAAGSGSQVVIPIDVTLQYCDPCWHCRDGLC